MKTTEQRLAELEEQVKDLRKWHVEDKCNRHLGAIAQRIADKLFDLGSDKVDMRLIAKLNEALGCDVMPLANKATKKARKYARKNNRSTKP
jgi:hypothetical protein